MGKLIVLNVLVVILAVYTSARYTYDNKDPNIDEEIENIAKALNVNLDLDKPVETRQANDEIDCAEECEVDDDNCDCVSDACYEAVCVEVETSRVLGALEQNTKEDATEQGGQHGGLKKKILGIRLPRVRLPRIRIPRIRLPRVRLPRIRLPRIRLPRIHLPSFPGKK